MECAGIIIEDVISSNILEKILRLVFLLNLYIIFPIVLFIFFMTGKKNGFNRTIVSILKTIGIWSIFVLIYLVIRLFFKIEYNFSITCVDGELYRIGGLLQLTKNLIFVYIYIFMYAIRKNFSKEGKRELRNALLLITIILEIAMWFVYPLFEVVSSLP